MVSETERAIMQIIYRINLLETEYKRNKLTLHAHAAMKCKWAAQDVLEELSADNGYF